MFQCQPGSCMALSVCNDLLRCHLGPRTKLATKAMLPDFSPHKANLITSMTNWGALLVELFGLFGSESPVAVSGSCLALRLQPSLRRYSLWTKSHLASTCISVQTMNNGGQGWGNFSPKGGWTKPKHGVCQRKGLKNNLEIEFERENCPKRTSILHGWKSHKLHGIGFWYLIPPAGGQVPLAVFWNCLEVAECYKTLQHCPGFGPCHWIS